MMSLRIKGAARKVLSLALLEANPLENIRNTQQIYAVMFNGRLFTRADLKAMMVGVEAAARNE